MFFFHPQNKKILTFPLFFPDEHSFKLKKDKHYIILQAKSIKPTFYRGADKSLARPGRKQATATEDFALYISYLLS